MKTLSYLHVITILLLAGLVNPVFAQQERKMSLEEVINTVLANNWQLRMGEHQIKVSQAELMSTNSAFLPSLSFTETFTNTNDPMMAFGTKLGQSAITSEDFNPERLNHPDDIDNFATRVHFNQPLFNLDGIYGRQAAKAARDASVEQHAWSKEMIMLQTKGLYFNIVLAHKGLKVINKSLHYAEENFEIAKDLYEQGIINNADLMGAQLRFTQLQSKALQAQHFVADLNQRMLQLLGSPENEMIVPTDSLGTIDIDINTISTMELADNRADIFAMDKAAKASELNMKAQKSGFAPRVNAFGSYGFNDTAAFGNQSDNYMVGVQLKWDLFQGGKQIGKTQKAKHESEIAYLALEEKKAQVQRDLMRLKNELILAKEQVALSALAAKQAQEVYTIRVNRFAEGLEKTSDLLMDESNFLNKQLDFLKAKNNYIQLLFKLETELSQKLI